MPRSADYAWATIIGGVIVYELKADDLLSEATERYCGRHPVLTRLVILAVAGHLAVLLPPVVDVFSAKNLLHRGVVAAAGIDRRKSYDREISGSERDAVVGVAPAP
jgi:hypothetical protein